MSNLGSLVSILFLFVFSFVSNAQTTMYWVGGSGDWDDISHWRKTSGGPNITGSIPNEDVIAVIDDNSGLTGNSIITIPPGEFAVLDFVVSNSQPFSLIMGGSSSSNDLDMFVYRDIDFNSAFTLKYNSFVNSDNVWKFVSNVTHSIRTGGQNLVNIEFVDEDGTYNLQDNLLASNQIRMYGGTWNSNGRKIDSKRLFFRDNETPANALTKVFNASTSRITCEEWYSKLTYGSLTVTGNHKIYTEIFVGSPKQLNGPAFTFNEIHLLELDDQNPSGIPTIEYNNFECTECEIEKIIIEDTGNTKFGGKFTVNNTFEVTNVESTIQFNGGNGREDEVVINGNVVVPKIVDCNKRTIFTNIHNEFTTITRTSGTLEIRDAILVNQQASGSANFVLKNGVLQGSSSGWQLDELPEGKNYVWIGGSGSGYGMWNDPNSWELLSIGAPDGCIPSIVDNVFINENARRPIEIPLGFTAECNDFIWENKDGISLLLNGGTSFGSESDLVIAGDFFLHASANFLPVNRHEIFFSSAGPTTLETNGVQLPDITFVGGNAQWILADILQSDQISFASGTFNTNGKPIITDYWSSIENDPKHLIFGASKITVNGEMALSRSISNNVTVDAGTSVIICEELTCSVNNLHDVKLVNPSSTTLTNVGPYIFNDLILAGTGQVTMDTDLTVSNLIFETDGSSFAADHNSVFTINDGIESLAQSNDPALLKSRSTIQMASIDKPSGNLCVIGNIEIQDINAIMDGVFHAPDGQDLGNNLDINFDKFTSSNRLYWVAGSGVWDDQSNWSQVSGGCSASKDPGNFEQLYFDNNGIFSDTDIITIPVGRVANNLFFQNSDYDVTISITSEIDISNLDISDSRVDFIGKGLNVRLQTIINNGATLVIDLIDYSTKRLSTQSGIFLIREGSIVNVTGTD